MYKRAGITDIKKFYEEKFATDARFDVSGIPLWNYNINFAKYFWIYRNVKPNSRVLDFGCGSGTLAVLKSKGCKITGIDYSKKALEIAKKVNNYDSVFCGSIFEFDQPPKYFDYIVSLDVFGHIPFEEKDAVIQELKKYLKDEGVMLHGIECGNVNYDEMTGDELKAFVEVDGHVGIENKARNINRFKKFFQHTDGEVRFNIENSADEYIKQSEEYKSRIDPNLTNYLKSLSAGEKIAFDIANGLVQIKMEELKHPSPDSSAGSLGFMYLRASGLPLREPVYRCTDKQLPEPLTPLHDPRLFCRGWHAIEKADNSYFRWGANDSLIRLTKLNKDLRLKIFSAFPDIKKEHVTVFFINEDTGRLIYKTVLKSNNEYAIFLKTSNLEKLNLSIFVDTTWKPALYNPETGDWRTLGIGIREISLL
ncbi:MAG: class I SAM-dependent methyltransferase [Nitrospirae bacterium]|nr:class I SAM-dependent methyltransferase [Nitrospirota bacterium]